MSLILRIYKKEEEETTFIFRQTISHHTIISNESSRQSFVNISENDMYNIIMEQDILFLLLNDFNIIRNEQLQIFSSKYQSPGIY